MFVRAHHFWVWVHGCVVRYPRPPQILGLDQHSSALHILASGGFVVVGNLTLSGSGGSTTANMYSGGRPRACPKLELWGVLTKSDIQKLGSALDPAAYDHHPLSNIVFHSGLLPVALAKGAMAIW